MSENGDFKLGYELYIAQSEMIRAGEGKRVPWNSYIASLENVSRLKHAVKMGELLLAGAREDYELRMKQLDKKISEIFASSEDPETGLATVDLSIDSHRQILQEMDEIRDDLTEAEAEHKRVLDGMARSVTELSAAHGRYQRARGVYEAASVNLYNLLRQLPAA